MNRSELANKMFTALDTLTVSGSEGDISINDLLNPQQKYDVVMQLVRAIPLSPLEQVQKFNESFKVEKEITHIVMDYKHKALMFKLILDEVIELGFSLGFSNIELYKILIRSYKETEADKIEPSLLNTFDALIDILFVVYGAVDRLQLAPVIYEGFKEVTASNMSKLIKDIENNNSVRDIILNSVQKYKKQNIPVRSNKLHNGYISITSIETNKILKPVSYFKPDLNKILTKFLKEK